MNIFAKERSKAKISKQKIGKQKIKFRKQTKSFARQEEYSA